tara:strand:- start:1443 stop:1679 length:237 start_codon:yes stop_codon:yes gene_type:complete
MAMFKPEDYELSLEKTLRLRLVNDDIDKCTDVEVLQKSLKETTRLLVTYQHLMAVAIRDKVQDSLNRMLPGDASDDKS